MATTVTLGTVAWPMMKKVGYRADDAGGLLAAGGLGAIISPPVLGAAAFLIAEYLKIGYLDVLKMAVIPTILYYFSLYFMMTGIHALHMIVGIGIMLVILVMALRGRFSAAYYTPVEVSGLYWHFVDIVWIFLFPLLYLLGAHYGAGH